MHCTRRPASRAACTAGKSIATNTPMIAMTTSNSTSVKPRTASRRWPPDERNIQCLVHEYLNSFERLAEGGSPAAAGVSRRSDGSCQGRVECPGTKHFSTCRGKRANGACRTGLGLGRSVLHASAFSATSSAPSSPYRSGRPGLQQATARSVPGSGTVEMPAGERAGVASAGARQQRPPTGKAPKLSSPTPPPKPKITEAPSPITRLLAGDKALSAVSQQRAGQHVGVARVVVAAGLANANVPAPILFKAPLPVTRPVSVTSSREAACRWHAGGIGQGDRARRPTRTLPVVCNVPAPIVTLPLPRLAELEMPTRRR